jgi:hypothetical protein
LFHPFFFFLLQFFNQWCDRCKFLLQGCRSLLRLNL